MITKLTLLAMITLASAAMAMDQETPAHTFNSTSNVALLKDYTISDFERAHPATHTTWPPYGYILGSDGNLTTIPGFTPSKEKINLAQLFSFDTGFPSDDRTHELAHILLGTEKQIDQFRLLSEDIQITTAVVLHRLATEIEMTPYSFDEEAFKLQCANLLSGAIAKDSVEGLFIKTEETSEKGEDA